MEFALFLTGCLWALAARTTAEHAASGIAVRLSLALYQPLLDAAFLLFLLLVGFTAIHWIAIRSGSMRSVNALPSRPASREEWGIGAALGWALVVMAILPMLLGRTLHPSFWFQPRTIGVTILSLAVLLLLTLAQEVVFRGYLFARLIRATGPTAATILMSVIYAAVSAFHPQSSRLSVFIAFLLGVLFSLAYLRTHALWLPWGLHFAWSACTGILFGLPVAGWKSVYSTFVDTAAYGPDWLTGGPYGPDAALFTLVVVIGGMPILYLLTRDLAWEYTHPPIIAAGYPMDVAPPAEHIKMEQSEKPAPLVQILSSTPTASSTMSAIDEHLRSNSPQDS